MAGILASMAAGGAAGGFKAYGDTIDENIKAKREAEKEAVLEARMKNMMELQQKYQTSERVANQAFQTRNEAKESAQDQALANYMSIPKGKQGGDEYSGPVDRESYIPQMSGKGILSVREQQIREEDRDEDRTLKKEALDYQRGRDIKTDALEYAKLDIMKDAKKSAASQKIMEKAIDYATDRIKIDSTNGIEFTPETMKSAVIKYRNEYLMALGKDEPDSTGSKKGATAFDSILEKVKGGPDIQKTDSAVSQVTGQSSGYRSDPKASGPSSKTVENKKIKAMAEEEEARKRASRRITDYGL